jgi:tetratricopeptide (TPR) repeat protein
LALTLSVALLYPLFSFAAETPADWAVPGATLRVDVRIQNPPDHPDLGILVKIPDGGQLPGKYPVPDVRDAEGKPVEHIIVGHNPTDALGVLFAQPQSGDTVHIYFKGSATPPPRPSNPRLYPSVLYYAKNGNASLDTAKRMASEYPPAQGAAFNTWSCVGCMVNPYGPDDDFSSWYVGAILLKKKENIYFATVSDEGSEFWIDGKMVHSWPGNHTRESGAKGQHGATVELGEGLHRVDYYHFEAQGKQEAQLTWRRKGITEGPVPELVQDFAKSGTAAITAIRYKDGRLGAAIRGTSEPNGYFWTGEKPLNLFTLSYSGVPADDTVSVTWEFGKDKRIAEPIIEWLVAGDADQVSSPVTLAISNAAGVARTSARLVCPWTPTELSLDNQGDRLNFRKALYNMIRAVPKAADPSADWTPDHWGILVDLLEPYRAGPILHDLFTRSFETLQKLPVDQRYALEDRFIETLRLQRSDKALLEWIDKLEKNEKNSVRKFRWKDERVCAYLFDVSNAAAAKREVVFLREGAISPDQTQIAALRQGDVERALGNTEAAIKFYKDAQERYRSRNKTGMAGGRLAFVDPKKRKQPDATNVVDKAAAKKPKLQTLTSQKKVDDWKIYTVHDASMYATITAFLAQDAVAEALQKLSDWENESPHSKLSGEYPLAEAKVYVHVEDYRRAINALETFRKGVTMSAQLADAMKLEVDCLQKINDKARTKEIAADFVKRFPGHPFEAEMKEVLAP